MATLELRLNPDFSLNVTARESDEYTCAVFLKFENHIIPENIRGVNEMFMSPVQLELLGRFLIRQAEEIKTSQTYREVG